MTDLFPESLQPEALGFRAVTLMAACFFALYPDDASCDRIAEQQREQCRRLGLHAHKWRSPELFHVSIAQWGATKRLRQPLDDALKKAKERFHHPAFDVTLVATARLNGQNGEFAFVLEADSETARNVHSLRHALADAEAGSGLVAARGAIRPHVTIGYGRDIPDEAVPIAPIRFRARRIEMAVSELGTGTHHHLDRWALHEPGQP